MSRIILLESNSAFLNELKAGMSERADLNVVYAGDDGEAGIRKTAELKPDLLIVGMFLRGIDGIAVIRDVKAANANVKIIATGVSNDTLMERAMREGADYYLVKPFSIPNAIARVEDLLSENDAVDLKNIALRKQAPFSIDEKISDIFISIGIPPHIKGYSYLREGVKTTVATPSIINNVTKGLYPSIAERFATTPSKVERAIRHAIEVAWNRGRIDAINAVFGARVYLGSEKPTNSEFIALVADKLILENLV